MNELADGNLGRAKGLREGDGPVEGSMAGKSVFVVVVVVVMMLEEACSLILTRRSVC